MLQYLDLNTVLIQAQHSYQFYARCLLLIRNFIEYYIIHVFICNFEASFYVQTCFIFNLKKKYQFENLLLKLYIRNWVYILTCHHASQIQMSLIA